MEMDAASCWPASYLVSYDGACAVMLRQDAAVQDGFAVQLCMGATLRVWWMRIVREPGRSGESSCDGSLKVVWCFSARPSLIITFPAALAFNTSQPEEAVDGKLSREQ